MRTETPMEWATSDNGSIPIWRGIIRIGYTAIIGGYPPGGVSPEWIPATDDMIPRGRSTLWVGNPPPTEGYHVEGVSYGLDIYYQLYQPFGHSISEEIAV